MSATPTDSNRAFCSTALRWAGRCLLFAAAAAGFYLVATRTGHWPQIKAIGGAIAVGALSLVPVLPYVRRPEKPVEMPAGPVNYPLVVVDSDRRFRWQFGIRSLMVLTTVVALITAIARRDGLSPIVVMSTLVLALILIGTIAWGVSRLPSWAAALSFLAVCLFVAIILTGTLSRAPAFANSLEELLNASGPLASPANRIRITVAMSVCVLVGSAFGWAMAVAEERL